MKIFKKIWNLLRADCLPLVILIGLVYFTWQFLPTMVIRHDGFMYLVSTYSKWFYKLSYFYTGFENSAVFFGLLFAKLFSARIEWYFITSLLTLLLTVVLYYWMSKAIFTSRFIAFASAFIFGVSFYGSWDMYSARCYCFFLERIIPVVFLFPSFMTLILFLKHQRRRYLTASLLLYFFAIGIAHFEIFITPAFFFYPLFWYMFSTNKENKNPLKGLFIGSLFAGISIFFVLIQQINESGLTIPWGYSEFIFHPEKYQYFYKMARQLASWSFYPPLSFSSVMGYTYLAAIDTGLKQVASITHYVLIVYALICLFLWKLLPERRPLILTTIFGTAGMFFLNALFNHYDGLSSSSSRYLYFPTFLLALFWAMVLEALKKIGKLGILVCCGILIWYYCVNSILINQSIFLTNAENRSARILYSYIRRTRTMLSPHTVVVVPYPEFWSQESEFFTEYLGGKDVTYYSDDATYEDWKTIIPKFEHVIKIQYDRKCDCVKETEIK